MGRLPSAGAENLIQHLVGATSMIVVGLKIPKLIQSARHDGRREGGREA
jgi:hypothetical protein